MARDFILHRSISKNLFCWCSSPVIGALITSNEGLKVTVKNVRLSPDAFPQAPLIYTFYFFFFGSTFLVWLDSVCRGHTLCWLICATKTIFLPTKTLLLQILAFTFIVSLEGYFSLALTYDDICFAVHWTPISKCALCICISHNHYCSICLLVQCLLFRTQRICLFVFNLQTRCASLVGCC